MIMPTTMMITEMEYEALKAKAVELNRQLTENMNLRGDVQRIREDLLSAQDRNAWLTQQVEYWKNKSGCSPEKLWAVKSTMQDLQEAVNELA